MAIYHLSAKVISRGQGRSVVAAAAYRSGSRLADERQGLVHDYSRRRDVRETFILAPSGAPAWVYDRQALWTAVDVAEKRKDAQTAREVEVALPRELTPDQQRQLVRKFVEAAFVERGMVADVAIHEGHNDQEPNPHAHILLTTRAITPEGFGGKNRDWNAKDLLVTWRNQWEYDCNEALAEHGHTARVDARSLAAQKIDRPPTVHEGPAVRQMERRGQRTERSEHNRLVHQYRAVVVELEAVRQAWQAGLQSQRRIAQVEALRAAWGWPTSARKQIRRLEEAQGRVLTRGDVQRLLEQARQDPRFQAVPTTRAVWQREVRKLERSQRWQGRDLLWQQQGQEARTQLQSAYGGWLGLKARMAQWRGDRWYATLQETIARGERAARRVARRRQVVTQRETRVVQAREQYTKAEAAANLAQNIVDGFAALLRQSWSREEFEQEQARRRRQQELIRESEQELKREQEWER